MSPAAALPRKPRILVVDDIRANQLALEAVLGDDYEVTSVDSGEKAIALLERPSLVDLILMDVQMPGMDGFETTERIRQIPGAAGIPIIFVTAVFTEDPFVKKGYEVGGFDYFTKPFDPELLRRKVGVYAAYKLNAEMLENRERHLRRSEEVARVGRKLASVLENLPVGVLISDTEGRICQTTEGATRIFGCADPAGPEALSQFLGWWDVGGRMITGEAGPLARALDHGETSHGVPTEIRCFDGSSKTILVSASPLTGLDGERVGAVVTIQDVTHATSVTQDLERRVTELVKLGVELEETVHRREFR